MRSHRHILILACAGVLAAVPVAGAQRQGFRLVEQGIEDVEPAAVSLRVPWVDLREPLGFDEVWQGLWSDPFLGEREVFMRSSGAITAVFPRSSYVQTEEGTLVEIPAGTIFYLGRPPAGLERAPERESPPGRIDLRRNTALTAAPSAQDAAASVRIEAAGSHVEFGIWTSETYRTARVARLLRSAAGAESSDDDSGTERDSRAFIRMRDGVVEDYWID